MQDKHVKFSLKEKKKSVRKKRVGTRFFWTIYKAYLGSTFENSSKKQFLRLILENTS